MTRNPKITEEMIDAEIARQDYEARGGYAPPPVIVQKVELTRSVIHIAAGVLLGNLLTGVIGGIVFWIIAAT